MQIIDHAESQGYWGYTREIDILLGLDSFLSLFFLFLTLLTPVSFYPLCIFIMQLDPGSDKLKIYLKNPHYVKYLCELVEHGCGRDPPFRVTLH